MATSGRERWRTEVTKNASRRNYLLRQLTDVTLAFEALRRELSGEGTPIDYDAMGTRAANILLHSGLEYWEDFDSCTRVLHVGKAAMREILAARTAAYARK